MNCNELQKCQMKQCRLVTSDCTLVTQDCSLVTQDCSLVTQDCSLVTKDYILVTLGCIYILMTYICKVSRGENSSVENCKVCWSRRTWYGSQTMQKKNYIQSWCKKSFHFYQQQTRGTWLKNSSQMALSGHQFHSGTRSLQSATPKQF